MVFPDGGSLYLDENGLIYDAKGDYVTDQEYYDMSLGELLSQAECIDLVDPEKAIKSLSKIVENTFKIRIDHVVFRQAMGQFTMKEMNKRIEKFQALEKTQDIFDLKNWDIQKNIKDIEAILERNTPENINDLVEFFEIFKKFQKQYSTIRKICNLYSSKTENDLEVIKNLLFNYMDGEKIQEFQQVLVDVLISLENSQNLLEQFWAIQESQLFIGRQGHGYAIVDIEMKDETLQKLWKVVQTKDLDLIISNDAYEVKETKRYADWVQDKKEANEDYSIESYIKDRIEVYSDGIIAKLQSTGFIYDGTIHHLDRSVTLVINLCELGIENYAQLSPENLAGYVNDYINSREDGQQFLGYKKDAIEIFYNILFISTENANFQPLLIKGKSN